MTRVTTTQTSAFLSSEPIKKKFGAFLTSMSYHKVKCAETDKKWGFLLVRRKSISKS